MSNLIPKSLASQKNVLYKNITWVDLIFCFVFVGIAIATGFAINDSIIIRLIISIIVFICLISFLLPVNKNNERLYQFIVFFIKYICGVRKYSKNSTNNVKQLIPYQKLKENSIVVKKNNIRPTSYIKAIKIKGNDITNLDYEEQISIFSSLKIILKNLNCSFSIIKFDEPLILERQAKYILQKINELDIEFENNKISEEFYCASKYQLYSQLDNFYHPSDVLEGISESKSFYIFIYNKKEETANLTIDTLHQKLRSINIENDILNKYELVNVIKNIFNPLNENIDIDIIDENEDNIDNLFNFDNLDIHYNNIKINDKLYINISSISDYPLEVEDYWLASIIINTNASLIWNIGPLSTTLAKSLINKAIVNAQADILNTNKNIQKRELSNLAVNFEKLADNVASDNDQLKNTSMFFINYGLDKKSIQSEVKKLRNFLSDKNIKLDELKFRQLEAFKASLPKIWVNNELKNIREIPISTIAHGYPFLNNSLLDNGGLLLGYNSTRDSFVFNQFDLSSDQNRKNYNMLLLGTSGSGKSYTVKKILNWHIINNRKVIIIDPEREYKDLCHYYSGNWLDASNGNISRINPLQILNSINELTDNVLLNNVQLIQNHIQFLEEFFSILYPDISQNQLRLIGYFIKEIYFDFKIHKKVFKDLKSFDFPTMNDLAKKINNLQQNFLTKNNINIDDFNTIKSIINNDFLNNGKFQTLYNGYSTILLDENLITIDINELFEKGNKNIIQAQLFLILALVSNAIKNNTDKEIIIAIDEAHLLIDKDNPVGLNFMFQMVKRIRKRNGGIILITQNPDDFLASEEIIKKTTAMINNTQYMMVLNLSARNIKDIEVMFKSYGNGLSEAEKNYIARARRGQGLFMVSGFNRHMLNVKHSKFEEDAYKNIVRSNSIENPNHSERKEIFRKQTIEISKRLNNQINYLKNIAQTTTKKQKKNEVQRAIRIDNDKYISGIN